MLIKIIVNNISSKLQGIDDIDVVDALDRIMSYYVEGYRFTKAFREGWYDKKKGKWITWDGKKHLLTRKLEFPTGLLQTVFDYLDKLKVKYEIIDNRPEIKLGKPIKTKKYKPREYQQEAVDTFFKKGRGIIRIGTGGGKSFVSAMIAAKYNIPTMIYVIGKDLLYQFHRELSECLPVKIGIIGDGQCDVRKINICSVWTAITSFNINSKEISIGDEDWAPEILPPTNVQKIKIKKAIENTNLAIYDEAQYLATETIQSIFKASKNCRYIAGLTGTDWRDDGADLLLESICGQRIYNMPSSELIKRGYLVKPKITMLEVPPYPENLPRHYGSVYSKYISNNDDRNNLIISAAFKLIEKGRKVLILVRHLSHGKLLMKKLKDLSTYFINGLVEGQEREEIKQEFIDGHIECIVASSVFDQGVDLPPLDALILACAGRSSVRTLQRIGRVIRSYPGKKDAIVVDFIDNARYLDKHSATRVSIYETEPEFHIKFPKGFDDSTLKRDKKIAKKISK